MTSSQLPFTPRVGDIVFSRVPHNPLSVLIRAMNGFFPYSHTSMIGKNAEGETVVYTTNALRENLIIREFGPTNLQKYLSNKEFIVSRYEGLSASQRRAIEEWCVGHTGEKFSVRKLMAYLSAVIKGLGVKRLVVPGVRHKVFFYEAVARAYQSAGIKLNKRAGNTDPTGYDIREIYYSPKLKDIYISS